MAAISDDRARAKSLAREHKDALPALASLAYSHAKAGDEQLAFELFRAAPRAVAHLSPAHIDRFLPFLHDWNSTDSFASFVSGVAWRNGILSDQHILAWTTSPNLWTRRAALVSTVPLNLNARGATAPRGEATKTLAICKSLVADHEDMIVKALSWALRTLAGKDTPAVQAFIRRHESELAARVLRETGNKLTTGLKNPKTWKGPRPKQSQQRAKKATPKNAARPSEKASS